MGNSETRETRETPETRETQETRGTLEDRKTQAARAARGNRETRGAENTANSGKLGKFGGHVKLRKFAELGTLGNPGELGDSAGRYSRPLIANKDTPLSRSFEPDIRSTKMRYGNEAYLCAIRDRWDVAQIGGGWSEIFSRSSVNHGPIVGNYRVHLPDS